VIKRTLYFGSPVYLSTKDEQLVISFRDGEERSEQAPIEDLGIVMLDHPQITISQSAIAKLTANNTALITCNHSHHPTGLLLPLDGSTVQGERFRAQIESSLPLRKQLWAQTISAKITNQAALLENIGIPAANMRKWAAQVTSGDPKNL
jgi:CRISPR-associated protein Cas1